MSSCVALDQDGKSSGKKQQDSGYFFFLDVEPKRSTDCLIGVRES